jgi:hypothetical protein
MHVRVRLRARATDCVCVRLCLHVCVREGASSCVCVCMASCARACARGPACVRDYVCVSFACARIRVRTRAAVHCYPGGHYSGVLSGCSGTCGISTESTRRVPEGHLESTQGVLVLTGRTLLGYIGGTSRKCVRACDTVHLSGCITHHNGDARHCAGYKLVRVPSSVLSTMGCPFYDLEYRIAYRF